MKSIPDISIVIVNFNGVEDTTELLNSLKDYCSDISHEVIVVDNGSSSDEAQLLRSRFENHNIIRSEINLGFAGGNNAGIQQSKGRYIFLLNNDTVIEDDSLKKQIEFMDSNPIAGAVSPKILFYYSKDIIQYAGFTELSDITLRNRGIGFGEKDLGQYSKPKQTAFTHGAAMIVRRDVINEVGLMPECYFLYYEEYDWCEMFKRAGFKLWYYPDFHVLHKESRSTGKISNSKIYYLTRNRLLFADRNRKGAVKVLSLLYQIFVSSSAAMLRQALSGNIQGITAVLSGIKDFLLKREGKWNK